jgi:hypothetical protein
MFMQESHELHWKDAKCILIHVQGTITFGILYAIDSTLDLIGFTDSDWAGDRIDRKSTYGYLVSLGSRAYLLVENEAGCYCSIFIQGRVQRGI